MPVTDSHSCDEATTIFPSLLLFNKESFLLTKFDSIKAFNIEQLFNWATNCIKSRKAIIE